MSQKCDHLRGCEDCRKKLGRIWGYYLDVLMTVKVPIHYQDEEGRDVNKNISLLEDIFNYDPALRKRFKKALKI